MTEVVTQKDLKKKPIQPRYTQPLETKQPEYYTLRQKSVLKKYSPSDKKKNHRKYSHDDKKCHMWGKK